MVEGVVPTGQRIMERLSDGEEFIVDCQSGIAMVSAACELMKKEESNIESNL